jgi:rRNA-processing protein EBP2
LTQHITLANINILLKDAKFGYGGKKRGSKRNTKESTSSMDDGYSVKKNKSAGFNSTVS